MRADRGLLGLEHLPDLIERGVSPEPPRQIMIRNDRLLPRPVAATGNADVGTATGKYLFSDLRIAQRGGCLATQHAGDVGFARRHVGPLGESMMPHFMGDGTCDPATMTHRMFTNDDGAARIQIGPAPPSPDHIDTVVPQLRQTASQRRRLFQEGL
ncbi:hypothetical protein A6R73_05625 [Xanthomonas translucens pv. poae]|uniref:Uncharacterized protein n=1 Tax=Xanthomonas graminis pv. poae TaxID=227946 RepID=A0A199NYQ6_9XANT|nr:hypothetical protein A6R73_05625 [Xanthomonas translucens pv. poae]